MEAKNRNINNLINCFIEIKIIAILYVRYMFEKVKEFELRGRICEVAAAERLNINHHIWYKNVESVKIY